MINSLHLLQDDEVGNSLLEMLQQKAETWAEAGIITVVLNRYFLTLFIIRLTGVMITGYMND
jgi:hypothetical protein